MGTDQTLENVPSGPLATMFPVFLTDVKVVQFRYALGMSIFSTSLQSLTPADLKDLLDSQAVENLRLEFKREIPTKDEAIKKLSSFGNTFGGFLVVGATADSKDGRIIDLPGVAEKSGVKQQFVDWCFNEISPPLQIDVSDPIPTPNGNGQYCYVIRVLESDIAPHFLNRRKGIWVRNNEFSGRLEPSLATESELRQLFERRRTVVARRDGLIARSIRRYDALADLTHTGRSGERVKLGSRLEITIVPRFPASSVCSEVDLKQIVTKNVIAWRQVMFPDVTSGIITQHESAIILHAAHESYSMFEMSIWGSLFYGTQIDDNLRFLLTGDFAAGGPSGIHSGQVAGIVLAITSHANKTLQSLGYSGPVHIKTSLKSIRGVEWVCFNGTFPNQRPGSKLDDEVEFSVDVDSEDLATKLDGVVMSILRLIFFSVDLSDLAGSLQQIESTVRFGYRYNIWTAPATLLT